MKTKPHLEVIDGADADGAEVARAQQLTQRQHLLKGGRRQGQHDSSASGTLGMQLVTGYLLAERSDHTCTRGTRFMIAMQGVMLNTQLGSQGTKKTSRSNGPGRRRCHKRHAPMSLEDTPSALDSSRFSMRSAILLASSGL